MERLKKMNSWNMYCIGRFFQENYVFHDIFPNKNPMSAWFFKSMKYERLVICDPVLRPCFDSVWARQLRCWASSSRSRALATATHGGLANEWDAAARFTIMGCCCLLCTHFHGESRRVVGDPSGPESFRHFLRRCVESS